jgi:hypothetical protein
MLSTYPSNLFLLSRRGTEREKGECPVDMPSLCNLHNAIVSFRLKNSTGGDLAKEAAFKNLQPNWSAYQRKYAARIEYMKRAPRIHPVIKGREISSLPSSCALLGTLSDLTVGGKTDRASSFSCALRPEIENSSPPMQFSELYSKRCIAYNTTNLSKITGDQLINFQLLVRMEIQFLASWDVEWEPSSGKMADGGAISTDSPSEDVVAKDSLSQDPAKNLSLLIPAAPAAGSVASAEERILRYALHLSKPDLTLLNGEESHREACFPTADAQSSGSAEVEGDISDIVNWGYNRGDFPLTLQGLQQMEFDHKTHPLPPKYVFPAAILLFVCAKRSEAEEAAFHRLCEVWSYWFDKPLSYAFLKDDPPLRLNLNPAEIEWCKVKLDYLGKQLSSDSDRERLGLPTKKRIAREGEAALLLPRSSIPDSSPAARDDSMAGTSANAAPAPQAAATASGSESVNGGDGIAEEDSGGNVEKTVQRKRAKSENAAGAAGAPAAAKRAKQAHEFKGGSPVKDEEKTTVRESDGKTVSLKDGRIVAAGNDLKKLFPNTYRNADNTKTFDGKNLNLGEAFKLACVVQYGPNLPIDMSGHISMRSALFRTAAYYALIDEEVRQIMDDPKVADFFYFLVKSAKQIVYTIGVESRLIFGDAVFSRHIPARLLRGTSNIISVHYAVTVFSNLLFSMQSIWACQPTQPSCNVRIG